MAILNVALQRRPVVGAVSNTSAQELKVEARGEGLIAAVFWAMASPCEVLLPSQDRAEAVEFGALVAAEAWRVERKFSRYLDDSVTARIHASRGIAIEVDQETASLLDFARQCHELSDGAFDITSGVLRHAWKFDGSDRVPDKAAVAALFILRSGHSHLETAGVRVGQPQDSS